MNNACVILFAKILSRQGENQNLGKFSCFADPEWNFLSCLLPDEKNATVRPLVDVRSFLSTIFYLLVKFRYRRCDSHIGLLELVAVR